MTYEQLTNYLSGSTTVEEPSIVSDFKFTLGEQVHEKITLDNPDKALLPYYAEVVSSLDTLGLLQDISSHADIWKTKLGI